MTVLHLPSWFPNENNRVSGIFTAKHIRAFSQVAGNRHFILNWHNTIYASIRRPGIFFTSLFRSWRKSEMRVAGNICFITFEIFQSNERLFGNNMKKLINRVLRESLRLLKKEPIDLIHAHVTYPAGFIAMQLSEKTGIPYIISEHMGPFPFEEYTKSTQWLAEHVIQPIRKARKVIAVSNTQKAQIRKLTGVEAVVIPNTVDEQEFPVQQSHSNPVFTFLLVAQLDKNKGVDILLKAAALLVDKRSDFLVRICGRGSIQNDLKKLAHDTGIDNRIEWLGMLPRQEVVSSIQCCDCLVSCSRFESFGVTLVEALAAGKPVIATRSGGPADIVNEQNGLLIEKEDPKALADAMLYMIQHAKDYSPENIRQSYLQRYSTNVIAQRYYDEVYSQFTP